MDYISEKGTLNCEPLKNPQLYTAFSGQFEEEIDVPLCRMMVEDTTVVKLTVQVEKKEEDGSTMTNADGDICYETIPYVKDGVEQTYPLFSPESKKEMEKILRYLSNGSTNLVRYSAKRGNIGRRYCEYGNNHDQQPNPSLTTISRNIRNTLYHYMGWKDWDFVASHPTVLSQLARRLRVNTPCIDAWIADKDPIVKLLSEHHSVPGHPSLQKDHIKTLVCLALYGGGLVTWANGRWENGKLVKPGVRQGDPRRNQAPMEVRNVGDNIDKRQLWREEHPWFNALKKECKNLTEKLWKNNPELIKLVCDKSRDLWRQQYQFMSYYLGALENHCLYHAYKYFVDNELILNRKCSLAYDGFTAKSPSAYTDLDHHQTACNQYIFEQTGFAMKLIEKPFDISTLQQHILEKRRNLSIPVPLAHTATLQATKEGGWVGSTVPTANEDDETARVLHQMAQQEEQVEEEEAVNEEEGYADTYLRWRDRFEMTHCKIINNSSFIKITYHDADHTVFDKYLFFTKKQLIDAYEHLSFTVTTDKGKIKKVKYILAWLEDRKIKHYQACNVVPPPGRCPSSVFNLWRTSPFYGQDITPSSNRWVQAAVDKFVSHCDILCDHETVAAVYMLKWLAHLIQKPAEKTTHIIITGEEGTGKTLLFSIIKKFIGGGVFETSAPERDVWGNFNTQLMTNLLIILSETDKRNSYGAEGKIKALITDPEVTINPKGKEPFVIKSFHRFVTLTNHPDPIKLERGQRRHVVIHCSAEKKQDWRYFETFKTFFENEDALLTVYSYLNNMDIDGFNFQDIPRTAYAQEVMDLNRNPVDDFFLWWVARQITHQTVITVGDNAGCVIATGAQMLVDFKAYKEIVGGNFEVSGAGDLIRKISLFLKLPKGAVVDAQRTSKSQPKKYNIEMLKKHYRLGRIGHFNEDGSPRPLAAGGEDYRSPPSADILVEDESKEVDNYAACDDGDVDIEDAVSDAARRTSSLLSMLSVKEEIDEVANEMAVTSQMCDCGYDRAACGACGEGWAQGRRYDGAVEEANKGFYPNGAGSTAPFACAPPPAPAPHALPPDPVSNLSIPTPLAHTATLQATKEGGWVGSTVPPPLDVPPVPQKEEEGYGQKVSADAPTEK